MCITYNTTCGLRQGITGVADVGHCFEFFGYSALRQGVRRKGIHLLRKLIQKSSQYFTIVISWLSRNFLSARCYPVHDWQAPISGEEINANLKKKVPWLWTVARGIDPHPSSNRC
ncbi:hypothetical protein RF11_10001 [Thelohanellus kitauei]|uniref:Uncharacterized protein n=1 Tax=Thelohanellus kitauei TaxID=669202 RepID=A0A0C2ITQ7_THEKT|nr:hypothetical protein RF11_10001 [Thelohanellus kitauei]